MATDQPQPLKIDRKFMERLEKEEQYSIIPLSDKEAWIKEYKEKAMEKKAEAVKTHDNISLYLDSCEEAKAEISEGELKLEEENKTGNSDEKVIKKIQDRIQQHRDNLDLFSEMAAIMKKQRKEKIHQMEQYHLRADHWRLIQNGWRMGDSSFGIFYYESQEVYEFIKSANPQQNEEKAMVDAIWKMRRELNVKLVEGLHGQIFL